MKAENIGSRNLGDLSLCNGEQREKIERKNVLILSSRQNFIEQNGVEIVFLSGSDFLESQETEALIETTYGK
jgi:hypothetical protein